MTNPKMPAIDNLKVFISSTMNEFRDIREVIERTLTSRGLRVFIYEVSGATPHSVTNASLLEVESSDIYVGLFGVQFGEITAQEFRRARELRKPCFIYIRDKDVSREVKLENWLQKEVLDPVRGVGYKYFDSGMMLVEQVATDIMAWLVSRYRELTAEIMEAPLSTAESAKLQAEADQLQRLTDYSLPLGDAIDLLASQMRAWFEALNYGFERHALRESGYFEWIIRVPVRRGYDRILVHGIEGEAGVSHVQRLREAVEENGTDEGWLVAMRRVGQAARNEIESSEKQNLFCYTFDDLIDTSANFDAYLDWLDREVQDRGINQLYVPLACIKTEFDPKTGHKIGEAQYNKRNGGIDSYIDQWLDDPSKEHISILGEFGTGKTWFALHYAWVTMQRYRDAKDRGVARPRLPLVISLRDYAKAVSVESLFSEFFFRKYQIPLPNYTAFEQLNRMGKLLLIFDGFDEMADRVDRQKMINNFWELSRVVVPGAKAILTCRTEHFPDAKEGRALLNSELRASVANLSGQPPQFETLELAQFDDAQIVEVLLSRHTDSSTIQRIRENPQLFDLARRPLMTELIVEAIPEIKAGKPIDLSRVYLYAVRQKMERDIKQERTFTSLADKLFFLCELSWQMLSTNQTSLNYRLFPTTLRRLFGPIVEEQKDLDHWHFDMMGQTILVRNALGDYSPAHRSLLEFFVAYKFAAEMGLIAEDFVAMARERSGPEINKGTAPQFYRWSSYFDREVHANGEIEAIPPLRNFKTEDLALLAKTVGLEPFSKAILDLLQNMLVDTDEVYDGLKNIITLTKGRTTEEVGCLGGNAATLLVRRNPAALREQNFMYTNLNNANFSNADLTACNLRGANLNDATLVNTKLANANLRHAELFNAHFAGVSEVASVAFNHDGSLVAEGGSDGYVHIWDVMTQQELHALGGHKSRIRKVAYDRFGSFLATLSAERVQLWNVERYTLEETIFAYELSFSELRTICFNPSKWGQMTVGGLNGLKTLDRSSNTEITWQIDDPSGAICYNASGEYLIISSSDSTLGMYQVETQVPEYILSGRHGHCLGIDISPDESGIAALWLSDQGDGKSLVRGALEIYQIATLASDISSEPTGIHETLTVAHASYISTAASPLQFLVNGRLVAVVGTDTDIHIRDVISGNVVTKFTGHSSLVTSLCLSQDRNTLASGSLDGTIKFWDVRPFAPSSSKDAISQASGYPSRASAAMSEYEEWWMNSGIDTPPGAVRNPNFSKCLGSIERQLDYGGMQLNGAKGLDTVVIAEEGYTTLGNWLIQRGAKLE